MKKSVATLFAAALCGAAILGAVSCGTPDRSDQDGDTTIYTVYAPDGAPALALSYAMACGYAADQNGVASLSQPLPPKTLFDYRIVDSALIQTYVTGDRPAADFCILPLNAASKLLGTGETYRMLGTVTNGNLYFLTTGDNAPLSAENLSELVGKTVGVVQLTNVPGLTLQVVLGKYGIGYQIVENPEAERASDKVNLLAVEATNVTPAYGCDYYLCPEPAATAKINGTASSAKPFFSAGDLQELYGGDDGYPQAVLVAKNSAGEDAVAELISYMSGCAEYLQTASPETVLSLLAENRTEGLAPAFTENTLNAAVIENCSVWFTPAADCKLRVNAFLEELIAVNETAAKRVSDAFFYGA